jgi:hypothetical protein
VVKRADIGRNVTDSGPNVSLRPRTISLNGCSISVSEHLKLVPDVLESLISEKRLLQAAVLLVRSLKTIKKQDMLDIGAVADLRAYFIGQESVRATCLNYVNVSSITDDHEQALRDILIDELHNHLYLKSFWCENRWAAYTIGQQSSESLGSAFSRLTVPVSPKSRVRRRAAVFERFCSTSRLSKLSNRENLLYSALKVISIPSRSFTPP